MYLNLRTRDTGEHMSQEGVDRAMVEADHLREGIRLIREELRDMREELRADLATRPTHSDLGAAKLLMEKNIELLEQRIEQEKTRSRVEITELVAKVNAIEQAATKTREEKDRLQRQLLYTVIGSVAGLAATNFWQGLM